MKELILAKSGEIFLKFGFKSVTMDDIADKLGISKKTIYKYFKNKAHLVDLATFHFQEMLHNEALKVYNSGLNAVEENFEVNKVFDGFMQQMDESAVFQLKKYYPDTYHKMMSDEYNLFKDCVLGNIEKGIQQGLYRNDENIELSARFYFSLIMSLHDASLYTYKINSLNKLKLRALEYHTRAIATKKGLTILEQQLELNQN